MPKKSRKPSSITPAKKVQPSASKQAMPKGLPKDAQKKIEEMKKKLDKFQKKVVEKFDKYILGIALMPPPKPKEGEKADEKVHVMTLVDDTDSKKMTKEELKTKLHAIIEKFAAEADSKISVQTVLLSEVWGNIYDQKYELVQLIAMSAPIYDTGMLAGIKISEVHKSMVLKKFEKYIVSYVLSGSLIRGQATPSSDIDVFVVIDDTDVKKMTRAELKDKLRAIIIGMGVEAGEMTGIKNKINIQVYILTDFWDSLKEANPIIFTLLRDGVPFYDRGIFMPWKQLLKMGKIKPSVEAIDMFMNSGEQMLQRVTFKLREIGMEDMFYSMLTPSQAALMLFGLPPPTPRETAELMGDVFVRKEKLLEDKYVKMLERVIKIRKDLEHGDKKGITGREVDDLLKDAKDYLERIKKLFTQINEMKEKEGVVHIYDSCITVTRDALKLEHVEGGSEAKVIENFEKVLVHKGKVPDKFLRSLKDLVKARDDHDTGKLTKADVEKIKKVSHEYIKFMVEYLQRSRGRELDRAKVRVKYGEKFGEILLLKKHAYVLHDMDAEEKKYSVMTINKDGKLGQSQSVSIEEFEKAIVEAEIPPKVFIHEKLFEELKKIFGPKVEILVNY